MKLFYLLVLCSVIIISPFFANATTLFSPFGGTVKSYNPSPSDCIQSITAPILTATGGTTLVTVEEIEIGEPVPATVGILRVDFFTLPFLTTIYREFSYFVPDTHVVGNYINICEVCSKVGGLTEKTGLSESASDFCDSIPVLDQFLSTICSASGSCPITSLVHQIGISAPDTSNVLKGPQDAVVDLLKNSLCSSIGSIPVIGNIADLFCE